MVCYLYSTIYVYLISQYTLHAPWRHSDTPSVSYMDISFHIMSFIATAGFHDIMQRRLMNPPTYDFSNFTKTCVMCSFMNIYWLFSILPEFQRSRFGRLATRSITSYLASFQSYQVDLHARTSWLTRTFRIWHMVAITTSEFDTWLSF